MSSGPDSRKTPQSPSLAFKDPSAMNPEGLNSPRLPPRGDSPRGGGGTSSTIESNKQPFWLQSPQSDGGLSPPQSTYEDSLMKSRALDDTPSKSGTSIVSGPASNSRASKGSGGSAVWQPLGSTSTSHGIHHTQVGNQSRTSLSSGGVNNNGSISSSSYRYPTIIGSQASLPEVRDPDEPLPQRSLVAGGKSSITSSSTNGSNKLGPQIINISAAATSQSLTGSGASTVSIPFHQYGSVGLPPGDAPPPTLIKNDTDSSLLGSETGTVRSQDADTPLPGSNKKSMSSSKRAAAAAVARLSVASSIGITRSASDFINEINKFRRSMIHPPYTEATSSQCIRNLEAEDAKVYLEVLYNLTSHFVVEFAMNANLEGAIQNRQRPGGANNANRKLGLSHLGPSSSSVKDHLAASNNNRRSSSALVPLFSTFSPPASPSPGSLTPKTSVLQTNGGAESSSTHHHHQDSSTTSQQVPSGTESMILNTAMQIAHLSTTDFIKNMAAFNTKFENPSMAASVASMQGAKTTLMETGSAAVELGGDGFGGDDDGDGSFEINQYSVLQELGRGSQGCVYLAYDNSTNEFRALKELKRGLAQSSTMEKFKREVSIMKRLRHQNIVTLYEVIDDPKLKHIYLVMQYVEKGPLVQWIHGSPISPLHRENNTDEAPSTAPRHTRCEMIDSWRFQYFARQICAGLSYLHRRKIYHRDIKPENILLGNDEHVFLADFGVATAVGRLENTQQQQATRASSPLGGNEGKEARPTLLAPPGTDGAMILGGNGTDPLIPISSSRRPSLAITTLQGFTALGTEGGGEAGSLEGTPAYFAPELLLATEEEGKSLDQAAIDVWALGVTCFQLLTGSLPFASHAEEEVPYTPLRTAPAASVRLWNSQRRRNSASSDSSTDRGGDESSNSGGGMSISLDGSVQQPKAAGESPGGENDPTGFCEQLSILEESRLECFPSDWRFYLRAVVEDAPPYLNNEWQHVNSKRRKSSGVMVGSAGSPTLGSITNHPLADDAEETAEDVEAREKSITILAPSLSEGSLSDCESTNSSGSSQRMRRFSCTVEPSAHPDAEEEGRPPPPSVKGDRPTTTWFNPVPREWFSTLRGMLTKDPKKRWDLEQVRASIKAMGTLHKIESIAPTSLGGGDDEIGGSDSGSPTTPSRRLKLRALVNENRENEKAESTTATKKEVAPVPEH